MILIKDVSLVLQGATILKNIDLELPKGGITALIGPNGAGKSSLFSLIARLQPLQGGSISVDGLPVNTTPGHELARTIAILRQDMAITSRLTVRELIGFGRFPYNGGRLDAEDLHQIDRALHRFELHSMANRYIGTLSGGQRQRALVAMAFCQGTQYMLLDEPLNNLDMYYARELMRGLREISQSEAKTIIIVLHDINHAATYADRIVAMKDGRIVANGAPAEVLTPALLKSVYGYDMTVRKIDGLLTVLHHR